MAHEPDETSGLDPSEGEFQQPGWMVALICVQSFGALVFVGLAIVMGQPSFLCIAAAMLGMMAFAVLTPDIRREMERADAGHERAKVSFVSLHRKRMAALALVAVMLGATLLSDLFPEAEFVIVLGSIVLGAVAIFRFKYPFGL